MTDEQVQRATWALWRGGAGPILDRATAERLARVALEAALTFDPATPPKPEEDTMSEPQTVYVVSNGTGGEVNSVWTERSLADERAGALNAHASETLAWSVVTTSLVA